MHQPLQGSLAAAVRSLFGRVIEEEAGCVEPLDQPEMCSAPMVGPKQRRTTPEPSCRWVTVDQWQISEEACWIESFQSRALVARRLQVSEGQVDCGMEMRQLG